MGISFYWLLKQFRRTFGIRKNWAGLVTILWGEKMEANEKGFAELVLYVSRKSEDDPRFGSTKLNKILFYADFIHYGKTGRSITGAEYQRLEWGPAPRRLLPIQRELEEGDALAIQKVEYHGRYQKRTVALREPDLSSFSGEEIATVDGVIDDLWGANASDVSDLSHRLPSWQIAEENETIPYVSVFVSDRQLSQAEKDHARVYA